MIVIIINICIGIFQQIKAKITLDKLSLLDKNEYIAIRNEKEEKVDVIEELLHEQSYTICAFSLSTIFHFIKHIAHIAWASGLIECQILLSTDRGTLHLQMPA